MGGHLREMGLEDYVRTLINRRQRLYPSPFLVSAIGGGGKTSTLLDLFQAGLRPRSILTTTTAMGLPGTGGHLSPPLTREQRENPALARVFGQPPAGSGIWFGPALDNSRQKFKGLDPSLLDAWVRGERRAGREDTLLLCEADGSRRKPLKAHADHEPVIPRTSDLTLLVLGLSALGQALSESIVHRASIFSAWTGRQEGESLVFEDLLLLLREDRLLKGIPPTSHIALVFNQADCLSESLRKTASLASLAQRVLRNKRIDAVFFQGRAGGERQGLFGVSRQRDLTPPFSAVILAAGLSERMGGSNKLLLPLGEDTVLSQTLKRVLASDIRELVLVTGYESGAVEGEIRRTLSAAPGEDRRFSLVHNPAFREGQGGSVAIGTRQLSPDSRASFYIPGDQPFLSPALLRHLMEESAAGKILIPVRSGKRSSPVLFDRAFYPALSELTGDLGGRQVISLHEEAVLEIADQDLDGGFDLDTPEDYQEALALYEGRP